MDRENKLNSLLQQINQKIQSLGQETQLMEEDVKQDLYFDSYSQAISAALETVQKKGLEPDEYDVWNNITLGKRKPQPGETNKMSVGLLKNGEKIKKALHIQVYGMESGKYELNSYIL